MLQTVLSCCFQEAFLTRQYSHTHKLQPPSTNSLNGFANVESNAALTILQGSVIGRPLPGALLTPPNMGGIEPPRCTSTNLRRGSPTSSVACVFARLLACIFATHFSRSRTPQNLSGRKISVWKTHASWHPRAWSMKRNYIKRAFLHVFWCAFSTHDFLGGPVFWFAFLHASCRLGRPSNCQREGVCGGSAGGILRRVCGWVCEGFAGCSQRALDGPPKQAFVDLFIEVQTNAPIEPKNSYGHPECILYTGVVRGRSLIVSMD